MRSEIFNMPSHISSDKANLLNDRRNIGKDICKSFNEIVLKNG